MSSLGYILTGRIARAPKTGQSVQVDTSRINELFDRLNMSDKEAKNAIRRSLRESGNLVKNQTVADLKMVRNKDGSSLKWAGLVNFLRVAVYRDASGVVVTGLDQRKKTNEKLEKQGIKKNPSFILRFINQGTKERYARRYKLKKVRKKGLHYQKPGTGQRERNGNGLRYRGHIRASWFFTTAWESKKDEAMSRLEDGIIRHIEKIASKRK